MDLEATARISRRNGGKAEFYLCCRRPSDDENFHFSALLGEIEMLAVLDEACLFNSIFWGSQNLASVRTECTISDLYIGKSYLNLNLSSSQVTLGKLQSIVRIEQHMSHVEHCIKCLVKTKIYNPTPSKKLHKENGFTWGGFFSEVWAFFDEFTNIPMGEKSGPSLRVSGVGEESSLTPSGFLRR